MPFSLFGHSQYLVVHKCVHFRYSETMAAAEIGTGRETETEAGTEVKTGTGTGIGKVTGTGGRIACTGGAEKGRRTLIMRGSEATDPRV